MTATLEQLDCFREAERFHAGARVARSYNHDRFVEARKTRKWQILSVARTYFPDRWFTSEDVDSIMKIGLHKISNRLTELINNGLEVRDVPQGGSRYREFRVKDSDVH